MPVKTDRDKKLINKIKNLSISERIIIVEDIWDSIALSNEELTVTEKQKKDLDKRYKEYKNNPKDAITRTEAKGKIESQ